VNNQTQVVRVRGEDSINSKKHMPGALPRKDESRNANGEPKVLRVRGQGSMSGKVRNADTEPPFVRVRGELSVNPKSRAQRPSTIDIARKAGKTSKVNIRPETPTFTWWALPTEASVRETPPGSVKAIDRRTFSDFTTAAQSSGKSTEEPLFVNVGLDFGTSSSKIVIRLPYEAGQPTIAVPAPAHCRSDAHPYLWQTVVWLRPSGEFLAWPEGGAAVLHALKPGVLNERHDEAIPLDKRWKGPTVTRAEAATAYLAFVMRYVRGWLIQSRPRIVRKRHLVWLENVGLPAETLDRKELTESYRRIVAAAHLAASANTPLTVDSCKIFLDDQQVIGAAGDEAKAANLGIAVIPETAAEATGFFKSNNATQGAYLMVDVGALTLDACMFGYMDGGYKPYTAIVRPLGVESYYWFKKEGKTEEGFVEQCKKCLWHVVGTARRDHVPHTPCWKPGNELPVFLVGGGAQNDLHRKVVSSLAEWAMEHTGNNGIRFLELDVPDGIDLTEPISDFGRLAVAWGLSYPPDQIGEFPATSSTPKTGDLPRRGEPAFVSKDQV